VCSNLLEFSPVLLGDLNFHEFEPTNIGAISKLEESKEHFVAPVTIKWQYEQSWYLRYEAPWLKGFNINGEI